VKHLRVVMLTHEDLVPPSTVEGLSEADMQPFQTEYDVSCAVRELGHELMVLGVSDDLGAIRRAIDELRPDIVFNLLMEFKDVGAFQVHVASYLELLGVHATGCNSRGILLARDKALCKKILRYHRVPTPAFAVFRLGREMRAPRGLRFPLIVKSVDEEASRGIAQASVVRDEEHLRERVAFVHENVGTDALAEEYIAGRELNVSVIGNERLQTFPVWEMFFDKLREGNEPIATERAKWDLAYQKQVGIRIGPAELADGEGARLAALARRVYRALGLSGYARLDLRLGEDGRPFVLEANATPDVQREEEFAQAAIACGVPYPLLIQRILNLGLRYRPSWSR
jgi:D-alanine-D-alanine ligase